MTVKIAAVIILGAIAEVDRTSVFHGLLSEPIILAPLVGYILGEPALGLKIGAMLQLFFLGMVSMGGSSPPDSALASLSVTCAASFAARYAATPADVAMTVAVLIVMVPAGWAGKAIDSWMKESNVGALRRAEERMESVAATHAHGVIERAVWRSITGNFFIHAVATLVCVVSGSLLTAAALFFLPEAWHRPLEVTGGLLLVACAGIALASLRERMAFLVYTAVGLGLIILITGVI